MTRLTLRNGHDRRLRSGHPWIFSNEIESIVGDTSPGVAVEVVSARGEYLGSGYYNPHSLIAARLLTRRREEIDAPDFLYRRIAQARDYRAALYGADCNGIREVFGESDQLPGLVVDRYDDVLSVQLLTQGMERRRDRIVADLRELFQPRAIVLRNDVAVRQLEGLPLEVTIAAGTVPDTLTIREHGLAFAVDVVQGQKTGHFLDQKENHLALQGRVTGGRVLDLFCYAGSWAIHAARFGASEVIGIDISAAAVALSQDNAARNQATCCRFERADVFDRLRSLEQRHERFSAIVLDPPAFVKSRKHLDEAIKGYLTVNRRALSLLEPGGFLFTCSCSHHMNRELFLDTVRKAAQQSGRHVRLCEVRGQALDHPVLLNCPETDYLKCLVLQAI